jgi:hypothetical protein
MYDSSYLAALTSAIPASRLEATKAAPGTPLWPLATEGRLHYCDIEAYADEIRIICGVRDHP